MRKPTKTISGVTPLAVMLKPRKCNHGICTYCPQLNVPQSYTPKSPVVMRASKLNYNAEKQVKARLKAFEAMQHETSKIELIIMGGTFLEYPKKYKLNFIKGCYDALNNKKSKTLEEAKKLNEKAKHRCVALCLEIRPDICGRKEINEMLNYGATRVELGVQVLDDKIYKKIKRGHTIKHVVKATQLLKDSGFKIFYHWMLGLPGSNFKKDIKLFKKIFEDERFRPDGLKIYPCQVIPGSELVKLYNKGDYEPYFEKELIELLIKLKAFIPKYIRIARVMREIPPEYLIAGIRRIDLRNLVKQEMKKRNLKCKCIRCREIGYFKGEISEENIKLCRLDYDASNGKEIFLSFEDVKNDVLISLLRLRIPNKFFRKEIDDKTALIREIHTYGVEIGVGRKSRNKWQHKGYGKLLMKEAEKIAREEFKKKKIIVISGIGTRNYFFNLGYKLDGPYVSKKLSPL